MRAAAAEHYRLRLLSWRSNSYRIYGKLENNLVVEEVQGIYKYVPIACKWHTNLKKLLIGGAIPLY